MRLTAVLAAIVAFSFLTAARADIRVPPEKREPVRIQSKVTIKHGAIKGAGRNVVAKLILPASLVHPVGAGAPAPEPVPPPKQGALPQNMGTLIAGIALSLAAVSLVFVVRGKRTTRTVAATIMSAAILGGAYAAQADIPPDPRRVGPQIVIELVEEGDSVTLLLAE
jgi:hypothetical protein